MGDKLCDIKVKALGIVSGPRTSSWDGAVPLTLRESRHAQSLAYPTGKAREKMESEPLYNLLQLPKEVDQPTEEELPRGEKKKYLPPSSRKDPKFEELQKVLMEWINTTLLPEHIVVRSLEEDMFDGLILHHLFQKLAALKLEVEEISLTSASQRRKLGVILEAVNQSLQVEEQQAKWSVETIFNKDLLATLHLLVALAKHFQPELPLPDNVQVEVIHIESTKTGLKSDKLVEQLTEECSSHKDQPSQDTFDELFKLAPEKVHTVKEAIVSFVNQKVESLGLSVQSLDTQLHNVTLALELLKDEGLLNHPINPEDIVNKDAKSTLRILYSLFQKHALRTEGAGVPHGTPN
ncbi:gamma-parvin-like protein [Cricetulus griseus]|nr:gamma-parvin-like protein [Cricetulus griseus]